MVYFVVLMARSCYDPENAIEFWQRMRSANKASPPQFLSTHPSDETRVTQLTEWMPRATSQYEASDCANTSRYGISFFLVEINSADGAVVNDFFGRDIRG
jgi:metalloendopeptidase OMA1, mitochondrial